MAIWLCRAGRFGEYENKFLEDSNIYCTWNGLDVDLGKFQNKQELQQYLINDYDREAKVNTARNWASQIWPFAHEMKSGDWVMLPSKIKSAIHVGKITGKYVFDKDAKSPFYHAHSVDWFALDVRRNYFEQDILYSLGAFMTICRIKQEDRIKSIVSGKKNTAIVDSDDEATEIKDTKDIEVEAIDNIKEQIIRKFKGHGLARIVDSILRAKGFITYLSPEGPDKGVDILAAKGTLGFENPKICVQVKTSDTPVDRPTLDQLIGAMSNFKADYGLLVSWSGFKSTVIAEQSNHFFKVKFWTHNEIVQEFLLNYENLDDDIKLEIPLKKIWILGNIE